MQEEQGQVLTPSLLGPLIWPSFQPCYIEPFGIVGEDNKRRDGMTIVPWSHGRHFVWDFTCPDTLAPSHLRSTAAEAGSAAKEAEERKATKYRSIAACHTFIPFAVETLGPMGPEAKAFYIDLGRRLRQHTGEPRSTSYLIQRVSMAIQKGNAVVMMGSLASLPHGRELDELLQL